MLKKSDVLFAINILLILSFFGCSKNDYVTNPYTNSGGGSGTPGANEVWMQGTAFTPATVTVSVGTTIKWTNKDNMTHTVTSGTPAAPDGVFDSGDMANGATFSYTFNTKGTFKYFCRSHPTAMQGTVIVQ